MTRTCHATFVLLTLAALPLWIGCGSSGPELGSVTGTVTLGGKPLADALVQFQPEKDGSPSTARTDAEGHYELMYLADTKGALLGKHKVIVSTFRQKSNPDGTTTTIPERVPVQYTVPATSPLVKEVKSGSNKIDLPL